MMMMMMMVVVVMIDELVDSALGIMVSGRIQASRRGCRYPWQPREWKPIGAVTLKN